jgi:hypothetical protein
MSIDARYAVIVPISLPGAVLAHPRISYPPRAITFSLTTENGHHSSLPTVRRCCASISFRIEPFEIQWLASIVSIPLGRQE